MLNSFLDFILTKWYVNVNSFNLLIEDAFRFILTKWYVNVSTFDMCCGVMFMFYINYVDSKLNRKKKHLLK
ncbi:TPA: hypothetical protein KNK42_003835 [Clostridioides difficile]|uniref:Uncharacterized protein n=1 Tax=Clostridioides difficile TaxID=1496 RepID=A0AAN5VL50_CLODI|nr:hypothetical protein [Clostridioides difficile]DAG69520.1 MAG TPA: hypothetical protein [Caudoviricetes sp.]EGT3651635.1 hypothetical protein [Clostridioides difficile]EGT3711051.1 hypothetical protein [Clostridioides difficile]EII6810993.1 hypothetical protein [Clostridioides difficile]EIS9474006.1 hypothetical protein [Clostridioides difficile]